MNPQTLGILGVGLLVLQRNWRLPRGPGRTPQQRIEGGADLTFQVAQMVLAYQAARYVNVPRKLRVTFLAALFAMKLRLRKDERDFRAHGHPDPHFRVYNYAAEQAVYDFAAAGTVTAAVAAFLPDIFYENIPDWDSW